MSEQIDLQTAVWKGQGYVIQLVHRQTATEHATVGDAPMAVDVSTKYENQSATAKGLGTKEKAAERVRQDISSWNTKLFIQTRSHWVDQVS